MQSNGVYWVGADGNTYMRGEGDAQAFKWLAPYQTPQQLGYTQMDDPNPPDPAPTGGGGGGSGLSPEQIAAYDAQIGNVNSAIGRLGVQRTSGQAGVQGAYDTALQQLLLGKNQAEGAYNENVQGAKTDYVGAKNTIGSQAGEALNGLRRLLGSRGAGGGSAARILAPQAVARGATLQRADAGNQFAANRRAQDTSWGNYMTDYGNQVTGATGQRDEQLRTLNNSITQNNASLLQQLAQLQVERAGSGGGGVAAAQPYLNQANTLLDQLANSGPAKINYNTQAYQAPSLASYNTTPTNTSFNRSAGGNDYFSPYLQTLLGKKSQFGIA